MSPGFKPQVRHQNEIRKKIFLWRLPLNRLLAKTVVCIGESRVIEFTYPITNMIDVVESTDENQYVVKFQYR